MVAYFAAGMKKGDRGMLVLSLTRHLTYGFKRTSAWTAKSRPWR